MYREDPERYLCTKCGFVYSDNGQTSGEGGKCYDCWTLDIEAARARAEAFRKLRLTQLGAAIRQTEIDINCQWPMRHNVELMSLGLPILFTQLRALRACHEVLSRSSFSLSSNVIGATVFRHFGG